MTSFSISEEQAGKRLDVAVTEQLSDLNRSAVGKLCDSGNITVNGVVTKASQKVKLGDKVEVDYSPEKQITTPDIDLPVLYEDDDCIVINKPVGVLTHSKGAFNAEATVATFLASHGGTIVGERGGIVHRLDRATSGVIIAAKNPAALSHLQKQFSQRKVKKSYIAVVQGSLDQPEAIVDMPIERNPKAPATFRVGPNGKPAKTHYKVLRTSDHYSLLELKPETGRTHQLRVHMKHLGHPIVGDTFYEGQPADRLYLHAQSLEITLPNRQRQTFRVETPPEFAAIIEADA